MSRVRLWIGGIAIAATLGIAGPASAAEITVTLDTDGIAADADCTLREAITAANTNAAFDGCVAGDAGSVDVVALTQVQRPPQVFYQRSLLGSDEDANATGDLDILASGGPIRIVGFDAAATQILSTAGGDRVLDIIGPADVTLDHVGVCGELCGQAGSAAGNMAPAAPGSPVRGATVRAAGGAHLRLQNTLVGYTNVTGTGAEITGAGIYQVGGTLELDHSGIRTNTITWSANGSGLGLIAGAGIYMDGGSLIATASSFSNNVVGNSTAAITAPGVGVLAGGAIAKSGGTLDIKRSWFAGNRVNFQNTTQDAGNPRKGGALWLTNGVSTQIDESEFTGNQATTTSSLVPMSGGAIAAENGQGDTKITNTTFLNNQAIAPAANTQPRQGGAIYWNDNTGANDKLTIENSTFAGNGTPTNPSTPGLSQGGSLWVNDGNLAMAHVTSGATTGGVSTGNVAQDGRSIYYAAGDGTSAVRGSILAEGAAPECGGPSKPTSTGYNVEQGPANDCLFSQPTDVVGEPFLQAMADNGSTVYAGPNGEAAGLGPWGPSGIVQTRAVGAGPATGSIPREECIDSSGNPLTRDERGFPRTGASCNAGAVESECAGKPVTVTGTAGADVISGSAGDDVIAAGDGNDTINAGGGNDTICAGGGADTINGEDGDDLILSGAGTTSPANSDIVDGGDGADTISYQDASATVLNLSDVTVGATPAHTSSGPGTDTVTNVENAVGSPAADTLIGNEGSNVLDGGPGGNTTLDGRGGDDKLVGGANATGDIASFVSLGAVPVTVDHPNNRVTGQGTDTLEGIENVTGSAGDDTFIPASLTTGNYNGDAGQDSISFAAFPVASNGGITITAGAGRVVNTENITGTANDDVITGSAADNVLDGGPGGMDQVSFSGVATAVSANLATHSATGQGNDTLLNFDNLTGSTQADTLTGDDNDNVIDGRAQIDAIDGAGGSDTAAYNGLGSTVSASLITGAVTSTGQGNDTLANIENLRGSSAADTLIGNDGDNVIEGGGGADVVTGNLGNDTAAFTTSGSAVTVDLTAQTTAGGGGVDTMTGMESATGSRFDDVFTESAADNRIDGGAGVDRLTYAPSASGVTANLQTGLASGDGNDTIAGVENLTGTASDDTLVGDGGNNTLDGGDGEDTASWAGAQLQGRGTLTSPTAGEVHGQPGDVGDDILANIENLTGGNGNDILRGNAADNVLDGGGGSDTVTFAGLPMAVSVDLPADTSAGDGADSIPGVENVVGTDGDDLIVEDDGDNNLDGGEGRDELRYTAATGDVDVDLEAGTGTGDGTDTLAGFEDLTGSSHDDSLAGDAADNTIAGGDGDDEIAGAGGIDTVDYSGVPDGVDANLGSGVATGQGNDTLDQTIENVLGGAGDDTLGSSSADNVLDGGSGGNDTADFSAAAGGVDASVATHSSTGDGADTFPGIENLTGSAHADTLTGDPADNVLDGGGGSDTVSFAAAANAVTADLGAGTAGGDGNDTLTDDENVVGSPQADVLRGSAADNLLDGGPGEDRVDYSSAAGPVTASLQTSSASGEGNDAFAAIEDLTGSPGDDTLEGDGADNKLDGGGGSDTASFEHATGPITAAIGSPGTATGAGSDTLTAIENLRGSAGADSLTGDDADNVLEGGGGEDVVDAAAGSDTLLLRDDGPDAGDCGPDADPDSVIADKAGIDTLVNCDGSGDTVDIPPTANVPIPPTVKPPAGLPVRTCPKGKKLKHGKCKKKHKHKGKGKKGKKKKKAQD